MEPAVADAPERLWLDVQFRELFLPGEERHGIQGLVEYRRASPSAAARVLLADPEAVERMAAAIWNRSDDKIGWEKSKAMSHAADQVAWTLDDVRFALRAIAGETDNG